MHDLLVEQRHAGHPPLRLAAEKEIAGDVNGVAKREVLIDHLDARGAGIRRRGEGYGIAVDLDRARVWNDGA